MLFDHHISSSLRVCEYISLRTSNVQVWGDLIARLLVAIFDPILTDFLLCLTDFDLFCDWLEETRVLCCVFSNVPFWSIQLALSMVH